MTSGESGTRVLLVDDTPENIHVLGTTLRAEGYLLHVAENGVEALSIANAVLPDLILLDVMMPGMDGHETCRELKAADLTRHIPVIFLTAKAEADDILKGFESGAVDYVTKPFSRPELLRRVETHVTLRGLQVDLERRIAERARLLQRIVDMQEEERAHISFELHEQVGQQLTSVLVGLKATEAATDLAAVKAQTADLRTTTAKVVEDIQQMSFDLRPSSLDDMGLVTALRRDAEILQTKADFGVTFRAHNEPGIALDAAAEVALYRVVNAALANVVQHAQASSVNVIIRPHDGQVLTIVEDDGRGFDLDAVVSGPVETRFGMLAMQERIAGVGGEVSFETEPGEGSVVYITIPLRPDGS